MKSTLSIILAAIMVFAAVATISASAEKSNLTNVAKGCKYEYSMPYVTDPGAAPYRQVDGKELTDGIMGDSKFGTEWIGWYFATVNENYAIVDLGKTVSGIVKISLNFGRKLDWGVTYPGYVKFSVSTDGKTYTDLGTKTTSTDKDITDISVTIPDSIEARYVKAQVGKGGIFAFCSEFRVFTGTLGDEDDDDDDYTGNDYEDNDDPDYHPSNKNPDDKTAKAEGKAPNYNSLRVSYNSGEFLSSSSAFGFKGQKVLNGVRAGASVKDFSATLGTTSAYVTDAKGNKKTSGLVATGDKAVQGSDEAVIVILGDVDPDGKLTASDANAIKEICFGKKDTSSASSCAADINGTGSISVADYVLLKRNISGKYDMYSRFDDPDRSESCSMTYKMDSTYLFSVTAPKTSVGSVKITFDKKAWSTWNIGTWSVDGARVAGGGTDWEYVYRAGETAGSITFQGGNHGSEELISLKIYDNGTGKELSTAAGTTANIDGLKIVENTKIYYENSNPKKYFMAVTRTYYIIGERITLETEYELLNDTYFDTSYTGMFPVPKTQGLYITFHKNDGSSVDFTSLKVGAADYSGPYYGKTNSSWVTISGYQGKKVQFDVRAYGEDATHNFDSQLKTFYWDMNAGENKLYFAVFGGGNYRQQVKTGTRWSTKVSWKMSPAE